MSTTNKMDKPEKLPPEEHESLHVDDLSDDWKRLGWVEVEYGIPSTTLYGAGKRGEFPYIPGGQIKGATEARLKFGDEFEDYIENYSPKKQPTKNSKKNVADLVDEIEHHLDQVRILMNNLKDRGERLEHLESIIQELNR